MPLDSDTADRRTFNTMPLAGTTALQAKDAKHAQHGHWRATDDLKRSPPASTVRTCSLSACGCGAALKHLRDAKADMPRRVFSMPSTSKPMRFRHQRSLHIGLVSRCSFNQDNENFMRQLLAQRGTSSALKPYVAASGYRRRKRRADRPCHISTSRAGRHQCQGKPCHTSGSSPQASITLRWTCRSQHLHPAFGSANHAFAIDDRIADIDLNRRLSEREIAWAQAKDTSSLSK